MEIAQTCENCISRVYKKGNHIYCDKRKELMWRGLYSKDCYEPTTDNHILAYYRLVLDELSPSTNVEGVLLDWLEENGFINNNGENN